MTRHQPIASAALASAIGLALACVLFLGLSGCGDSSQPEPEPLATDQSTAQGGDDRTGASVLVLPLPGPTVQLDAPATVRVHLRGTLAQTAHYAAIGQVDIALQQPQATAPGTVAAALRHGSTSVALEYSALLALPAGRTALQATLTVRATDPATGLPSGALSRAEAVIDWTVALP